MMTTVLYGVYVLISVLLIIIILMQKSKTRGLGVMSGITSVGDSYYSKNKSKTYEGKLEFYTKIGIFLFIILAVVLNILINNQTTTKSNLLQESPEYTGTKQTTTTPATTGTTVPTQTSTTTSATSGTTETGTTTAQPQEAGSVTNEVLPVAPPATTESQPSTTTQQ